MPTYSQDLSATSGNAPTKQIGAVDPLTGMPIPLSPPPPPPQANTLGTAKPVFNNQTQQSAAGIYGDEISRVQSMPGALQPQAPLAKLDPMHDGKPGIQKEDFEQFKK